MGRHKSLINKYFDYSNVSKESTCKQCSKVLKGSHATNLKKHLKNHYDEYNEFILNENDRKLKKPLSSSTQMTLYSTFLLNSQIKVNISKKQIIDACVELVTVNGRPYSILYDIGFKKILDPMLCGLKNKVVLNSTSIRKYVHEESMELQEQISNEIHNKLISLKIDAVTRLNRSFLGMNLQYIINGYIQLRTIGLVELTESHTGIYLKDIILKTLKKFRVKPEQLYTITSDNGANVVKAVKLVEIETLPESDTVNEFENQSDLDNSSDIYASDNHNSESSSDSETESGYLEYNKTIINDDEINGLLNTDDGNFEIENANSEKIIHNVETLNIGNSTVFTAMRCVAHTLQLTVIDSLKDPNITKVLEKVRVLVRKLRNQTYLYLIKKENLKLPILDCLTRWHSTVDMLDRVGYLKIFIQNLSANDSKFKKFCLNNWEWKQIETISETLLPAKICTKKLQGEQLTLSDFYGTWISCKLQIERKTSPYAQKLLNCMNSRELYIMNNKPLISAIFLDPRYKIILNEEQCKTAIDHLVNLWVHLKIIEKESHTALSVIDKDTDNLTEMSNNINLDDEMEVYLKSRDLNETSGLLNETFSSSQKSTISTRIETLLKSYYIEQKRIEYKTNILEFWKNMEKIHPELYELVTIIFSVPGTQVSVGRLFSGLKFVLSPYRTNITSQNLEDQLLVRTNRLFEKRHIKK